MQKRDRKGQIQLSFGMIFSIIIVIATVAVAFYVITHFLNLSKCTKIGLFYDSLEKEVNNAWAGGGTTQKIFDGEMPSEVSAVCFGNLSSSNYAQADAEIYDYLESRSAVKNNVFVYPPSKACESGLASFKLQHVTMDNFFCVSVKSGKFQVMITKARLENLVRLSKP